MMPKSLSFVSGEGLDEGRHLETKVELYGDDDNGAILGVGYQVDGHEVFSHLNIAQMVSVRDWLSARLDEIGGSDD